MAILRHFLYDKRIRDLIYQVAAVVLLIALAVFFVRNASQNLKAAGFATGFDFLWRESGIDVPFVLTNYTQQSNVLALFWVGVVNTLVVSVIAMVLATLLGFFVGLARLSSHWLLSTVAGAFIGFVRNIPLLFFVLFWYFGVIAALPAPRDSVSLAGVVFLNNRGLTIATPEHPSVLAWALLALIIGGLCQWAILRKAARRKAATGQDSPIFLTGAVLLGLLPLAVLITGIASTPWDIPALRGFNYRGGFVIIPEFVALLAALTTYTAGFVAEIVRGGILAVPKGQVEAAKALGMTRSQALRFIIVPQAMRVIIPPMTSQYLNVLKNSSFGAVIAYPDIVSLFMGSALVSTNRVLEIIAMTLAVYLVIGLAVSAFMNWYNARTALVSR